METLTTSFLRIDEAASDKHCNEVMNMLRENIEASKYFLQQYTSARGIRDDRLKRVECDMRRKRFQCEDHVSVDSVYLKMYIRNPLSVFAARFKPLYTME